VARSRVVAIHRETILLAACIALLLFSFSASASAEAALDSNPTLLLFYQEECNACHDMDLFLETLSSELPPEEIGRYDIADQESFDLLERLASEYGLDTYVTPVVFIGDVASAGAGRAAELMISDAVIDCSRQDCPSPLTRVMPQPIEWGGILRLLALAALVVILIALQPL